MTSTRTNVDGRIVNCLFPDKCAYGIQTTAGTTYTCECVTYSPGEWSILAELVGGKGMTRCRLDYWLQDAPREHPQSVMNGLASKLGFTILGAAPQSINSTWWFWIEWSGTKPSFPPYLSDGKWLPIGSV